MPTVDAVATRKKRFTTFISGDALITHGLAGDAGAARFAVEAGEARRVTNYFRGMVRVVKQLADSSASACYQHSRGYALTADAKRWWHMMRNSDMCPEDAREGQLLNPWLRLGFYLADKYEPRLRPYRTREGQLDVSEAYPRRLMEHMVRFIRRVRRSKQFRDWVNYNKKIEEKNYRSCRVYLLNILRVHARPLIVRLDLYFDGDAKALSDSEAAKQAYDKFLRAVAQGKEFEGVIGYIGKRENGWGRCIHYHLLVAFDGNRHRQDFTLTQKLGNFWVDKCVGSDRYASFENCSLRKHEYDKNCIGLMHYRDQDMLIGLRRAVRYLCKEDSFLLAPKGGGRNLRKGQSPEVPKDDERRGAPRKGGNDVALAAKILREPEQRVVKS